MLLFARELHFAYRADRPLIRDASLALAAGQITVLLGPNGSGKSTLLKLLIGQLRVQQGEVQWEDRSIHDWLPRQLARVVAYLPQSPAFEPGQTVREVLMAGRTPYLPAFGVESVRDVEVVEETAARLNVAPLLDSPVDELSGGQRQRAFIGRALAQEPRALLLDEPSTFLDLRHQTELAALLRNLARQGLAILMASHDLSLSAAFADEMVLLHEGRIAARGAAASVLDPQLLGQVYGMTMERIDRPNRAPVIVPVM